MVPCVMAGAGFQRASRLDRSHRFWQGPTRDSVARNRGEPAMPDVTQIDRVLEDAVRTGQAPGVTAAAADPGGTRYAGAFGRRSLAGDAAMTLDTVFRIASMTKAITTV